MHWENIVTIYAKELRDLLRDRRTLISMIVVPLVLMPGLMIAIGTIAYRVVNKARATAPTVMVVGGEDSPRIRAALRANTRVRLVEPAADWRQRITEKKLRAAVEIPAGFDAALEKGAPATVRIYHYEGEIRSRFAVDELRRFLSEYREREVGARLAARGLPPALVKPYEISTRNVAPPEKVGGNAIGGLVPYLFLLLSFTGAMYPAMDLTAGEKERGTLETLLCSPVPRVDIVLGKFLMVLTASLGTVACSLVSAFGTLYIGGTVLAARGGAGAVVAGHTGGGGVALPAIDPLGLLAVVGMAIPVAVLFSAALLAISLFAKSFKEAQSYLSPLVLLIVLPAMVGMLPGVELDARLALVPILNVSLVSKDLVSGIWHWDYIALIFGSTCVYAAVALALAVRMFNREGVIFRA